MSNAKQRMRVLSLSLFAILGLMAFSAVGAQAKEGLFLLLNPGSSFTTEKVTEVSFTGKQEAAGSMGVPNRGLEITCQTATLSEGRLLSTEGHATILFDKCLAHAITKTPVHKGTLIVGDKTLEKCLIEGHNGLIDGNIRTKVLGVPVLHEGHTYILFTPLTGTDFAKIKFLAGKGCAFPLNNVVRGSVVGLILKGQNASQEITFNGAITLLFQAAGLPGDKLTYGEEVGVPFEAFLEGTAKDGLITQAGHVNTPWGFF